MLQGIALFIVFVGCSIQSCQPLLTDLFSGHLSIPITYIIQFKNVDIPLSKFKRSVNESTKIEKIANPEFEPTPDKYRDRRTANTDASNRPGNEPNLHLKANIRYHHQQRHPNGSVSGSYGQIDPKGQLQVMHYVSDGKGYREYPEGSEPGAQPAAQNHYPQYQPRVPVAAPESINVITNSDTGHRSAINLNEDLQDPNRNNRRNVLYNGNLGFVPNLQPPYPPLPPTNAQTPILQSAVTSVKQYGPKSPLFDKYYRPSPEEVQRTYEYHRLRSNMDVNAFRPPEANAIPDIPRDKQPELRATYNEFQIPYSVQYHDDTPSGYYVYSTPMEDSKHYNIPQYAPPQIPLDFQSQVLPNPQELYPRTPGYYNQPTPYPQAIPPQNPVYMQSYDGQPYLPGSTYSGPYVPNTATFNQPYPNSIPIYDNQLPQNVPTFSHQPPDNVPVYNLPPQGVYYSGSTPQPQLAASNNVA